MCIDAHLTVSFCKRILHREPKFEDIEDMDESVYKNLICMQKNDVDSLDLYFCVDVKDCESITLIENGEKMKVTNENKNLFINLKSNFILMKSNDEQVRSFCDSFDSLIDHNEIRFFTPNELYLLICEIPLIDVNDFIKNIDLVPPYTAETQAVKLFFLMISKWNNEKLVKLLLFMTGSSRVPANGFAEFKLMTGKSLIISPGGEKNRPPLGHTCNNELALPSYESEEEMNEKLLIAINECDSFQII